MTDEDLLQLIKQADRDGVKTLDLSGNELTSLPSEIGQLIQLETLILGKWDEDKGDYIGNQLAILPAEIGQLRTLSQLDLSANQLSQLPAEIGQLTNLTQLDLSDNQLSRLPAEIGQLTNLTQLDLSHNQLSQLPAEIGQLTNLTQLDLRANQLSQLPAEIGQLTNLTQLDLSANQLSQLPVEIGQLRTLSQLDLRANQLSQLPAEIGQLTNLGQLDLSVNQLSQLPAEIGQLTNLGQLDLRVNQLSQLPAEIGQLTNLGQLDLRANQLSQLPAEIGQLRTLSQLDLRANQLSQLPAEIGQLTNLTQLDLSDNQLSQLPAEIGQLRTLSQLDLRANQLSQLPVEIGQLRTLSQLDLRANQLSQLPVEIGQLRTLTQLDLSHNQLSQLPAEIGQLRTLSQLDLSANQLSQLPAEIGQLTNLTQLDLSHNQLSQLPAEIGQLTNLTQLDLSDNQLSQLPPEIQKYLITPEEAAKQIPRYYRQLLEQETDRLYEAKLLIVGEPGAGKTTLAKKIENQNYPLRQDEKSTEGIDVIQWRFPLDNGKDFQVNIWDFGGQEIYHATHQFFLTKRSLYALVADSRKEDTDFDYWLNVVALLSENSPLLIIKNEKQDRKREINQRQLRGQFTNLEETLATNLATKRGLSDILSNIKHYIRNLPHVGTPLPKTWVQVRQALEQDGRNHIPLNEYLTLCQNNGFTKREDKLQLSGYLHDLGVCLHFQDDPLLKKTVILNPTWGTDAVYAVLDNADVNNNLGRFTKADLTHIWREDKYADMQDELLQLMMKFKLCYEIPSRQGTYIAPQLLSPNQPEYDWDETNNLLLRYTYVFMPKGILTRFIVEMHPWIKTQICVWKTGVVLSKDGAQAEVIELYPLKQIHIRVSGNRRRDLLTTIRHELDKIHSTYTLLKCSTLVPCNCITCKGLQEPHFYAFKNLRDRLTNRKTTVECNTLPYLDVDISSLIDDVIREPISQKFPYPTPHSPVDISPESKPAQRPTPTDPEKEVFISYAWGGESEEIVDQLDQAFQGKGVTLIRDKRELGYKGRIQAFMERIGRGKCVVVVISQKYLQSENCMFELLQIAKNKQFYERIFPIVLDDAKIYKSINRIKYVKYWEAQIKELTKEMREVEQANLQGFREDIDLYNEIRQYLPQLTNNLKDMNTLTATIHSESGFEQVFEAVERKLEE